MKIGDKIPVTIAGQTVVMADVKELSEGTATLIVPATRVVMATKTELTVEAPTGGKVELLTDDVVRPENPEAAVLPPVTPENSDAATSPVANSDAAQQAVTQVAPPAPAPVVAEPALVEAPTPLNPTTEGTAAVSGE